MTAFHRHQIARFRVQRFSRRAALRGLAAAGSVAALTAAGLGAVRAAQGATPTVEPSASPTDDATPVGEGTPMATPTDIDRDAPVIARHQIEIRAPIDVVWALHTDIAAWPSWNPDITDVILERPLAVGSSFRWRTAGLDVRSTVYALTERARTLWGGPAAGITGIHEWTFAETTGGTRVATEESWRGAPVEADLAAAQAGLDQSLISWLGHLKTAAEAAV